MNTLYKYASCGAACQINLLLFWILCLPQSVNLVNLVNKMNKGQLEKHQKGLTNKVFNGFVILKYEWIYAVSNIPLNTHAWSENIHSTKEWWNMYFWWIFHQNKILSVYICLEIMQTFFFCRRQKVLLSK